MRNIAVILAGGTGSRMYKGTPGSDTSRVALLPKQFMPLDDSTVIEHAVHAFDSHPAISEVAIVIHPLWRSRMEAIAAAASWRKLTHIIDGGDERYLSSVNAISTYSDASDADQINLLLHDAARPWVSAAVIDRVVAALRHHKAVGVAIHSTDTVWAVQQSLNAKGITLRGEEGTVVISKIPERQTMWRAQTPQAFRLPVIREAYRRALQDPRLRVTDDCSVVHRYLPDVTIAVVEGDEQNRKITFAEDIASANNRT